MRPWRTINLQLKLDATCDKLVHILGLKGNSIETVISKVLVNFYGLKLSTSLYEEMFSRFCGKAKLPELKSLMKIPLMLIASCLVWNEENDTSEESEINQTKSYFMTFFYLKLEEITITRAENKHGIIKSFLVEKRQKPDMHMKVPNILLGFEPIVDFIDILKPVGRLALQDLISDEPHLVFPRNKLEREIGQSKVELALKAGILSKTKAPGLSFRQRVSLSFYHKSIQEFIAALYMTCGGIEALTSFRTHCNTVEKVMQLSNMIKFVCGLDSEVGCLLSEHVKDVVSRDADIIQCRGGAYYERSEKSRELYNMQCKWFSEMKQNLAYTHNTNSTPTLFVTDIYLFISDRDDVSVASELVSMEDNSIMSVYLHGVQHSVLSIIRHMPACKHITSLYIMNIPDIQGRELLVEVLPQLVQLQCVVFGYNRFYHDEKCPRADTAVARAVQHLSALIDIELHSITLTDTVTLPTPLETLELIFVTHVHYILRSLLQCTQLTCIELWRITLTDTVTLPSQLQKVKLRDVHSPHFILSSLPSCPHLTSLTIRCLLTMDDCEVLPQLKHLKYMDYGNYFDKDDSRCGSVGHAAVVGTLQHLTQLTHIKLSEINLGDKGTLLITPHMTQLQKVELSDVRMSARRWRKFVASLLSVQHTVHVTLTWINIDGKSLRTIHYSPHFTVTKEEKDPRYKKVDKIEFHTVQKLTAIINSAEN